MGTGITKGPAVLPSFACDVATRSTQRSSPAPFTSVCVAADFPAEPARASIRRIKVASLFGPSLEASSAALRDHGLKGIRTWGLRQKEDRKGGFRALFMPPSLTPSKTTKGRYGDQKQSKSARTDREAVHSSLS
jgi:hypothetical protein